MCYAVATCEFKLELQSANTQFGSMAPPLNHLKLCAIFRSHLWIQTGVTVRKSSNLGQNRRFFGPCNLDGWSWKTKGYLFYTTLNYVHHFVTIYERTSIKIRKRLIRFKIVNFSARVPLKFDGWPWKGQALCFISDSLWIQKRVTVRKHLNWGKICFDSMTLTLALCINITFINDNNSWKFHDDATRET